jgi:chemotaxis protein CheD
VADLPHEARGGVQYVRIAEIKVASHGLLKATLGSCVAIALINRKTGVCGLAHCLLPRAPAEVAGDDARFVDRAIANLMRAVGVEESSRRGISAYLGGGARMIADKDQSRTSVGEMNVAAAKTALDEHHIRFKVLEVGGNHAHMVVVDCESMTVTGSRIDQLTTR